MACTEMPSALAMDRRREWVPVATSYRKSSSVTRPERRSASRPHRTDSEGSSGMGREKERDYLSVLPRDLSRRRRASLATFTTGPTTRMAGGLTFFSRARRESFPTVE